MYEEDRARERWKALATRLWKQRNAALEQLRMAKDVIERGVMIKACERGACATLEEAEAARADAVDEQLAMLVGAWTERANATTADSDTAVMYIDTLRACRTELMGVLGLIHDGSQPIDTTASVKKELGIVDAFGGKAGR